MDDEYVVVAREAVDRVDKMMVPGTYWVEFLPFLKHVPWLPGTTWKKASDETLLLVREMTRKPYAEVKEALVRPASLLHFVPAQ